MRDAFFVALFSFASFWVGYGFHQPDPSCVVLRDLTGNRPVIAIVVPSATTQGGVDCLAAQIHGGMRNSDLCSYMPWTKADPQESL